MKKKILITLISLALSPIAFSANIDIKQSAPNQYDCTVDELELYIMKRTESLRKETTITPWEDFKKAQSEANKNGATDTQVADNSGASGNAEAEAFQRAINQNVTAPTNDSCDIFYSEMSDLDLSDISLDFDSLSGLLSGGLSSLKDMATQQVTQLGDALSEVVTSGICKRLSSDYLTNLGEDYLSKELKTNYGYTVDQVKNNNFSNKVINDTIYKQTGDSQYKLLNIMDDDLGSQRDSYINRTINNEIDQQLEAGRR